MSKYQYPKCQANLAQNIHQTVALVLSFHSQRIQIIRIAREPLLHAFTPHFTTHFFLYFIESQYISLYFIYYFIIFINFSSFVNFYITCITSPHLNLSPRLQAAPTPSASSRSMPFPSDMRVPPAPVDKSHEAPAPPPAVPPVFTGDRATVVDLVVPGEEPDAQQSVIRVQNPEAIEIRDVNVTNPVASFRFLGMMVVGMVGWLRVGWRDDGGGVVQGWLTQLGAGWFQLPGVPRPSQPQVPRATGPRRPWRSTAFPSPFTPRATPTISNSRGI